MSRTVRNGPGSVFADLAAERLTGDPEHFRGLALVALEAVDDVEDVGALDLLEGLQLKERPSIERASRGSGERRGQVFRLDEIGEAEDDQALDEVLQLAYVPRPVVALEELLGLRTQPLDRLVEHR